MKKYGHELSYHYQDFRLSTLFYLIHHLLEIPANYRKNGVNVDNI